MAQVAIDSALDAGMYLLAEKTAPESAAAQLRCQASGAAPLSSQQQRVLGGVLRQRQAAALGQRRGDGDGGLEALGV